MFDGATGDEMCPVRAVTAYAATQGNAPRPFFHLRDGSVLSKARFVENLGTRGTPMHYMGWEEPGWNAPPPIKEGWPLHTHPTN